MRPLPVRPVGGMPSFVRGLSVIRGSLVPVVDTGTLLGLPEAASPGRFVTLRMGERRVALSVEEVVGVRELASVSLHTLPKLLNRVRPRLAVLVGTLDAELLIALEEARLVPDWVWRSLDDPQESACPRG